LALADKTLLEIPAALLHERGFVRLNETADADPRLLARRILDGKYTKPFVVDDGRVKRLHFSFALVQSEMRKDEPWSLHLAYTRAMMAFLLLRPLPRHVVIVGLGGGSLTKFCHRHLPRTRITTVELNPDVIAFRNEFALPPDDERHRIICQDAAEYFATTEEAPDVVLLDGYDDEGIAPSFANANFYENLAASLAPRGLLVCNIAQKTVDSEGHLALLREVFGEVLLMAVPEDGNRIALAFNDPALRPDPTRVKREARALGERTGLDFAAFAQNLRPAR
jgi:spermidine synthase